MQYASTVSVRGTKEKKRKKHNSMWYVSTMPVRRTKEGKKKNWPVAAAAAALTFLMVAEGNKGRGTKSLPPILRLNGMFNTRSTTAAASSAAGRTSIFVAV